MMKNKIYAALLIAGMSGSLMAQAVDIKPKEPTKTVVPAVPVTPKEATLTENENLRISNYALQFALDRKQIEDDNKTLNQLNREGQDYVSSLEKKYNAKYDNNTGKFIINKK